MVGTDWSVSQVGGVGVDKAELGEEVGGDLETALGMKVEEESSQL